MSIQRIAMYIYFLSSSHVLVYSMSSLTNVSRTVVLDITFTIKVE